MIVDVDLGNDGRTHILSSQLLDKWCDLPARCTIRCPKIDQDRLVSIKHFCLEVSWRQDSGIVSHDYPFALMPQIYFDAAAGRRVTE